MQPLLHVEVKFPVGVNVCINQRGEGTQVVRGHPLPPGGVCEDLLDHQRVGPVRTTLSPAEKQHLRAFYISYLDARNAPSRLRQSDGLQDHDKMCV
jgi:hypothetical protein